MIRRYLGQCSTDDILNLEKRYSLSLPEDYRFFLLEHNGAVAEQDTRISILDLDNYIELDSFFGTNYEKKWLCLEKWMDKYSDELPANSLIVGRDILGGFIVLLCDNYNRGVYYWDSARNFSQSTDESNAYFIADNFTEVLQKIGGV